ncbi:DUF2157 domain-containing protein [Agrobacterium sp. SHOUNA12C]|uniref:DUF2157 domain-containing protein n=1 Tax=Rhizobium TaxID=379 RepID=UPI00026EC96B|nr:MULTISPECIES: DUF2157 domain-containing protein [Rhizobium]MCJ9724916.1 DUF2157 domain-containing protein [Agrobacterium sp. BETTINA12B]MCJ9759080.1 DUF2157 domain-containing protein [Agrobacterium sp. SHOUNA12C]OCJ06250.1 hypothetical protein A6U85_04665 [Agrobacterium sp. 13-626]EJK87249.1 putative membrane protein [Rhizobium sp. AP16]KEA06950.1 membrane protein [Rhizobium rhizogenes]
MYRGRLERDLKIWVDKGLVDAPAASAILGEYDSRPASFSAGRVLTVMAALLVGAAILLFVASNWEAIPRIVRLLGLVALIWAFYLGAAYLFARGRATIASALLILGTMTFGGAMSLVGQMYNISGDVLTMMIVWFAAAGIAAALFRSSAQVALAGFLAWGFCGFYLSDHSDEWYGVMPWVPPIMAAIIIVLVRYVDVPRARHLAYLMLVGWLTWLFAQYEGLHAAILLAAAGLIAFLAVSLPVSPLARIARTAGAAPAFYAFLVGAIGLLAIHGEISGGFFENDIWVQNKLPLVVLAFITLASAIIAIILGGRDNGALRYLAYFVFACEILYLANETVGSIIGTSGFFLISGMLVAIAAWLVIRLERRFSHGDGQGDKA